MYQLKKAFPASTQKTLNQYPIINAHANFDPASRYAMLVELRRASAHEKRRKKSCLSILVSHETGANPTLA
jgi:hypothetical protein